MQNWTIQKTISPAEEYAIEYRIKVGDSYETRSDRVSFASQSEAITEYETLNYIDKDGKEQKQDVVAVTIATTTTCVGAANPTRWKSKLEAGSPAFPGAQLTKRTETFNKYVITEDGPVESEVTTFEYEPRIAFAGGLAIENYKNIDLGTGNILIRKTIVQKEQNKAADLTLQYTTVYQAWGTTAGGKTAASAIMASLKRATDPERIDGTYLLVDRMSSLICRGVEKSINTGRGTAPVEPKEIDKQNEELKNKQKELKTNSSFNVTPGSLFFGNDATPFTELSFGADEASSRAEYNMQFAPDSYLEPASDGGGGGGGGDNNTGLTHVYASSSAAAYEYGKAVYAILSGMANGKSITTEFRNIPSEPMSSIYIEAAGTVGRFRANGITYAFDAQGMVAGCDAMLDGGAGLVAGGSGADWFPMAVPATNLSTLTPAVSGTPALANTIAAPGGFDPAAPGNIWSSLGTAGAGSDVYAAAVTKATVVGSVAETVRRESVSRSLSWLLTADYDMTPQTLSLAGVTTNYGTLQTFTVAENPGVAWVTNITTFDPGERRDGQGYNEGVAWVTPSTTFTPGGANNGPNPGVTWVTPATTFTPGARTDGVGFNPGVAWVTPATTFTPGARNDGRTVLLLLHMDGADDGTTFTDSSSYARTITVIGSAVTKTNIKKFGTASLQGTDGCLRFSPSITLAGDFTIACWFSANNIATDQAMFGFFGDANNQLIRLNADNIGQSIMSYSGSEPGGGQHLWNPSNSFLSGFSSGVFNYYAVTRQGSTVRLFVSGNLLTAQTFTGTILLNTVGAGFNGTSQRIVGNMDEVIITSECLYTASFTPPTAPF
jgi:hypothetical protein